MQGTSGYDNSYLKELYEDVKEIHSIGNSMNKFFLPRTTPFSEVSSSETALVLEPLLWSSSAWGGHQPHFSASEKLGTTGQDPQGLLLGGWRGWSLKLYLTCLWHLTDTPSPARLAPQ